MNDARKRRFDVVLVWRFDRLARSTKHLVLALEEFKNLGIDFISYQENIDTSSPLGAAIFTIIAGSNVLEDLEHSSASWSSRCFGIPSTCLPLLYAIFARLYPTNRP